MIFKPKLVDTLRGYRRPQFVQDILSGIIVGIIALPLAIAFAIASGVSPEKGVYTAIIAGFVISALGGSKVQIGGPTGAFIVIVYGIVQQHGVNGLVIATFLAGLMLTGMGFAKLGAIIKYIPYPLITGFTSGIALIIFSSQVKDLLGLEMGAVPADFVDKWKSYATHVHSVNKYALFVAIATAGIILFWPKLTHKVPGSLMAIIVTAAAVHFLHLPVDTIGSRFGDIPFSLPAPGIPALDLSTLKSLIQPAFAIALLGGIESLLSAVVADGMTGGNHRSNTELIAQGVANICSSVFGGIPATGAIARTAANVKNGGRTPVAGMIHALTLLLIMLFFGKWAALIPMATLAGVLVAVAYNMSEWEHFIAVFKGPKSDRAVLLASFLLTVFVDLIVAIEIGMVLAAFLFMRKMIQISDVSLISTGPNDEKNDLSDKETIANYRIPAEVEVFEITGPLFFGAVYKFKDAIRLIEKPPKVLIIRMRQVPIIDATGIKTIAEVHKETRRQGTKLILADVGSKQVRQALGEARLLFAIGKANVTSSFEAALKRCSEVLKDAS
ncbi:SulP family inorganic anion transporter [Foetidibacter luteolus]|uniref:SulP family inorganic anion transporter n=1 Tax=Foetidibacter luteolus TaxID=2608880 RepID=UPI001EEA3734|nr:SulP family inorganic anion transporter [Foetidibacter luteolus]